MTENLGHQCEVLIKSGGQTRSCHQLCLLQIQLVRLQLLGPTLRLGFALAFISSCRIMKNFFFSRCCHNAQYESAKVIKIWWITSSVWNCMSCRIPAPLLNIAVSQWHNGGGEETEVNTRLRKHTSLSLIRHKVKMSQENNFPTATI